VNPPTSPIPGGVIGATVTPRDQSVYCAASRSPVVWYGTRSLMLCPPTTFSIWLAG
jgi:hypothetical protein